MSLLEIKNLTVNFGNFCAVDDVSFSLELGQTLVLVGESGSGKSVTANSILRLLPPENTTFAANSEIHFDSKRLDQLAEPSLRQVRGGEIGMIFQEPMTSLNPLQSVRRQVGEAVRIHQGLKGRALDNKVLDLLEMVRLGRDQRLARAFPFELSGGQRQRVMIAMALANRPKLLIADEPTTALDATIQADILALLQELQQELGMALLFITHDLPIARRIADKVVVMQLGKVVEAGAANEVFGNPQHPYTQRLLAAEPKGARLDGSESSESAQSLMAHEPVVDVKDMAVHFPIRKGVFKRVVDHVRAVDGISLTLRPGETLGVLGESGSGKSTLGQALLGLVPLTGGVVSFNGQDIAKLSARKMRPLRRHLQMVFQDPFGSLSPRMSIAEIVAEGLSVHAPNLDEHARQQSVLAALEQVNLPPQVMNRYPHELSGGQRQRVGIARALILEPKVLVLDEPTSALDLSIQAELLDLLISLQERLGLAYLFISHDLRVVRAMAHRVMVMQAGKVVEQGDTASVFDAPQSAMTQKLLASL